MERKLNALPTHYMEELNNNIRQIIAMTDLKQFFEYIPLLAWLVWLSLNNIKQGKDMAVIKTVVGEMSNKIDLLMDFQNKTQLKKLAKRKNE